MEFSFAINAMGPQGGGGELMPICYHPGVPMLILCPLQFRGETHRTILGLTYRDNHFHTKVGNWDYPISRRWWTVVAFLVLRPPILKM